MQLDRVTNGQSGAVEDHEAGWSTGVTGDNLSNSQADSSEGRFSVPLIFRGIGPMQGKMEQSRSRAGFPGCGRCAILPW